MNKTCCIILFLILQSISGTSKEVPDRDYWIETMIQIVNPVLESLSNSNLKKDMPYESKSPDRREYSYLEAFGRVMCGISPWLELGPDKTSEGKLREKYIKMSLKWHKKCSKSRIPGLYGFSEKRTDSC